MGAKAQETELRELSSGTSGLPSRPWELKHRKRAGGQGYGNYNARTGLRELRQTHPLLPEKAPAGGATTGQGEEGKGQTVPALAKKGPGRAKRTSKLRRTEKVTGTNNAGTKAMGTKTQGQIAAYRAGLGEGHGTGLWQGTGLWELRNR